MTAIKGMIVAMALFQVGIAVGAPIQEEPAVPGGAGGILAWLLSAAGLTVVAQLLRSIPGIPLSLPSWARALIGPLLGVAAGLISEHWGVVVDFGVIEGALLGTTATVMYDTAKGAKKTVKG